MNEKVTTTSRILLGLGLIVFGLNGFLNFMPNPQPSPEAGAFIGAFAKTGYFLPMIKIIELTIGIMLVTNFFVPLALTLITPVLVGITSIHLFLNPAGLPVMLFLHALHGVLVFGYRSSYKQLLISKPAIN